MVRSRRQGRNAFIGFTRSFVSFCGMMLLVFSNFAPFASLVPIAHAATGISPVIDFQGKITNAADGTNIVDGTYAVQFKLYNALSGGTLLWTETDDGTSCPKLQFTSGVFSDQLGSCSAYPLTGVDFTSSSLYLSINFNPGTGYDGEMSPREQLNAAAYAFNANNLAGSGLINLTYAPSTATSPAASIAYNPSVASANNALSVAANSNVSGSALIVTQAGSGKGIELAGTGANAGTILSDGSLTLNTSGASAINIGSANSTSIVFGNAISNPTTTFNGSGLVTANNFASSSAVLTGGSINGVPIGATTKSTGAFTTLNASGNFNVTNPTLSNASVNNNSPTVSLFGSYWTGGSSAVDGWSLQDVLGTGVNPSSTLAFTHSGTSGISTVSFPSISLGSALSIANGGTNGTAAPTAGSVAYGTGTAYGFSAAGTANQILTSQATATPTFQNITSLLTAGPNVTITGTTNATIGLSSTGTFATATITPTVYGGTAASSTLTLDGTSNLSPSSAYVLLNPFGQGNVGVGTSAPASLFSVGSGSPFQVTSTGAVSAPSGTFLSTTGKAIEAGYNASNYLSSTTNVVGKTTFSLVGASPSLTIQPSTDNTSIFSIENSAGTSVFNIDSYGNELSIGQPISSHPPFFHITEPFTVNTLTGAMTADAGQISSDGNGDLTVNGAISTDNGAISSDGTGDLTVNGAISTDNGAISSDGTGDLSVQSLNVNSGGISSSGNVNVNGNIQASGNLIEKSVTFTPTTVGWYRVISGVGSMGGMLRITSNYDNQWTDDELNFDIGGYGTGGNIQQTNYSTYNTSAVNQIRISSDGGAHIYLDVYVSTASTPGPITIYGYGPNMQPFVTSPVVGATAGSTSVKTLALQTGLNTTSNLSANGVLTVSGSSNSSIQGNLGIGTTSPNANLEVYTGAASSTISLGSNGAHNDLVLSTDGAGNGYVQSLQNTGGYANLYLGTTNHNQLISLINSSGNVGIGTTSPNYPLQVGGGSNGVINDIAQFGSSGLGPGTEDRIILGGDSVHQFAAISGIDGGYAGAGGLGLYTLDSGTLTRQVTVLGNGNVGIGTTAPGGKLTVDGGNGIVINDNPSLIPVISGLPTYTVGEGSTIQSSADSTNGYTRTLDIQAGSANTASYIRFLTQNNGAVGATEKVRIDNLGNVGIGTTSPAARLNVVGPANTAYSPQFSWTPSAIFDNAAGSDQNEINLAVGGTNRASLRTDSGGNLVLSPSGTGATYLSYDGGSGGVNFGNGNGGAGAGVVGSVSSTGNLLMNGTGTFGTNAVINGGGTSYFNGGNVGIGTTTPSSTLAVQAPASYAGGVGGTVFNIASPAADGTNPLFDIYYGGDKEGFLTLGDGNGYQPILFRTGGSSYINGGNVGIGTASPASLLSVGSNSQFQVDGIGNVTVIGSLKADGNGAVGQFNATNNAGIFMTAAGGPGYAQIIAVNYANTSDINLVLQQYGGNVGIGTTNPTKPLQVNGTILSYNGTDYGSVNDTANGANIQVGGSSAAAEFITNFTGNTDAFGVPTSYVGLGTAQSYPLTITTNAVPRLTVTGGGYVGIGTTNPGTALQVNGEVIANEGGFGSGGYSFVGDGGYDTGMFSPSDGVLDFYNNTVHSININNAGQATFYQNANFNGQTTANSFVSSGATITGGSINSTPIGATTPSTGAFTSLYVTGGQSIQGGALGTTAGNSITNLSLENTTPNQSYLNFEQIRNANGTGWTTATTRIQASTDATNQSYIDFNPAGGTNASLAVGYGGSEYLRVDAASGNVGIGTTSPAARLNVVGPANTTYSPQFSWTPSAIFDNAFGSSQNGINLAVGGVNRASLRTDSGGSLVLSPSGGGATFLSFDGGTSGVNFGNGSLGVVGSVSSVGNLLMNGTGTFGTNAVINGGGTSYFNGGNVGIGTTAPAEPLQIGNGTSNVNNLSIASATGQKLFLGAYADTAVFAINRRISDGVFTNPSETTASIGLGSGNGSSYIQFAAGNVNGGNANEVARFTSDGRLGIGTTTPASTLSVVNSSAIPVEIAGPDTGASLFLTNASGWSPGKSVGLTFGDTSLNSSLIVPYSSGAIWQTYFGLAFKTGATTDYNALIGYNGTNDVYLGGNINTSTYAGATLTVLGNGNVGIGTTAPGGKLTVDGGNGIVINDNPSLIPVISGLPTYTVGEGSTIQSSADSTNGYTRTLDIQAGSANTASYIRFLTQNNGAVGATEKVRIDNLGNVGIGTTAPASLLSVGSSSQFQVNGSGNVTLIGSLKADGTGSVGQFNATNNAGIFMTAAGGPGYAQIIAVNYANTSDINLVLQQYGGNVGIGTTSPNYPLQVGGGSNGVINDIAQFGSSGLGPGTEDRIIFGGDAGHQFGGISGFDGGYAGAGGLGLYTLDSGTLTRQVTVLGNGNVGIGTTSPNASLDVIGTTYMGNSAAGVLVQDVSGAADLVGINGALNAYEPIELRTSATPSLYINTSGGVGINTVSPGQALQVGDNGTAANAVVKNGYLCVGNGSSFGNGSCNGASTAGTIYANSTSVAQGDYAESYLSTNLHMQPGTLVTADVTNPGNMVAESGASYDTALTGVISSAPGVLIGNDDTANPPANEKVYPIALNGRVPVLVTDENGPIQPGDYLTSSASMPGYAMKATHAGTVIGQALGVFSSTTSGSTTQSINGVSFHVGTVSLFVHVGFQDIGNTFVFGADDLTIAQTLAQTASQVASGNSATTQGTTQTASLTSAASSATYIIRQNPEGTTQLGAILQLQSGSATRFMVASDGATVINAQPASNTESIFVVNNNGSAAFSIDASGTVQVTASLVVKKDIAALGEVLGTSAILARNGDTNDLHQGDLVMLVSAQASPIPGNSSPVLVVEKATAANVAAAQSATIVGIVDRDLSDFDIPGAPSETTTTPTDVPSGDYLDIITSGTFSALHVDASLAAINIGDRLTISADGGYARKMAATEFGTVPLVGVALDAQASGTGSVRVYLMLNNSLAVTPTAPVTQTVIQQVSGGGSSASTTGSTGNTSDPSSQTTSQTDTSSNTPDGSSSSGSTVTAAPTDTSGNNTVSASTSSVDASTTSTDTGSAGSGQ